MREPGAALLRQHVGHPDGDRALRALLGKIDAERPAMRRQSVDVDQHEAMGGGKPRHGSKREIREVLVIDGIELVLFHQTLKMRHLDGDHAFGREQMRHA